MSGLLFTHNLHLAIELFGAGVFFLAGWLFLEAYRLKHDRWSAYRWTGFWVLAVAQVLHAASSFETLSPWIETLGLGLLLWSYLEPLPARPSAAGFVWSPGALPFLLNPVLLAALGGVLWRRWRRDIDRLLYWLAWGVCLLAAGSVVALLPVNWSHLVAHLLKIAGFGALGVWIWQWLTLRMRDEILIAFTGAAIFLSLLLSSFFSFFLLREKEAGLMDSLRAQTEVVQFHLDSVRSRALAAAERSAQNSEVAATVAARDGEYLAGLARPLLEATGQEFMIVAEPGGRAWFASHRSLATDENVLARPAAFTAREGRADGGISADVPEGVTVEAAAPVRWNGNLVGILIVGRKADAGFVRDLARVSRLEATVVVDGKVSASTFLPTGEAWTLPKGAFLGPLAIRSQSLLGAVLPLTPEEDASLALSTAPGELLQASEAAVRWILGLVLALTLAFILPLYRLAARLSGQSD